VPSSGRAPSGPSGRLSTRIAARVAHDVNNALAIFTGHFYLLRDGAEPLEEGLDAMEKAAANLERLARSLTVLGTLGIDAAARIDVNELVRGVVGAYPPGAVETRLEPGLPSLDAPAADLEKALRAVIDNAREAFGAASASSTPVLVGTSSQGDDVVVTIEDSGPGVPAEVRKREFDPLFSTKGERGRGIGITLAIVALAIAGGSLQIEDRTAGGTRAVLRIPKSNPIPSPSPANESG
jgi:signal transduction histidine kinase